MAFSKSSVLFLFWLVCFTVVTQSRPLSAKPAQEDEKNSPAEVTIRGEITSTKGPVSGAIAYVFRDELMSEAVSNEDGKFQVKIDSDKPVKILIVADGKISQIHSLDPEKNSMVEIQLKDQKALLEGRIIDNQGMSVEDAKLRVLSLRRESETIELPAGLKNDHFDASTNEQGVFQFDGIESSMVGTISVTGQGIVASSITGESFDDEIVLVVQPARIVQGKVIDRISKQPISNVVVSVAAGGQQAQVNDSGEFELKGLPAFQPLLLLANPKGEEPYHLKSKRIPIEDGFDPIEVEIGLEPGVWVKCEVNDFGTDGPASSEVFYFPTPENENFQSYVDSFRARGAVPSSSTNSTGDAKVVAIPGPGVVAIVAQGFPPNESVNKLTDEQRAMLLQVTGLSDLTAVAWIEPKDLKDEVELSFLVSKGRAIDVELVENQLDSTDPLVVHRAASKTSYAQPVLGPKFVAEQFQPGETRQILIHAPQKGLGAILNVKAEAKSPVQVVLEPTGSVVGQVVNKNGDPQSGLLMQFEIQTEDGYQEIATQVFTDVNGRFEKPSLIAALDYRVAAVRLTERQQMMNDSPKVDSRWYFAKELKINSGEAVDLGSIVLGATSQPEPQRRLRKEVVATSNSLPPVISGVITNEAGEPMADAMINFNTWPNRSGDLKKDLELTPTVLAQSRSDSNGNFQMTIDGSLEENLIASDANDGIQNAAIVVVVERQGATQISLKEISDPRNLKIQMTREMIVRGNVSSPGETQNIRLATGSRMRVYDVDSIRQITARLQEGISLEKISQKFQPMSTLDPLAGGLPLTWEVSSSGAFLVRNIPFNAIFELHAFGESGQRKTITVISRPMRGFDFKPSDDSKDTMQLQGSRIRLDLVQQGDGK